MALGKNVRIRREQLKMSQGELADAIGVSQTAIALMEKRDSKSSRQLTHLARTLRIAPSLLENGDLSNIPPSQVSEDSAAYHVGNVEVAFGQQRGKIPVISWVQAGVWSEAIDLNEPGIADEWVPRQNGGELVYGLYVQGESMTAPPGMHPSFPPGMIIHVDPEQSAGNGDFVIANVNGHSEVTFKQLRYEDGRPYLKPLNAAFPNIFDEFSVLGKVIAYGGLL